MALNKELTAMILVESSYFGDKRTAKKFGISDRTIRNYRQRLNSDEELAKIFREKNDLSAQEWAHEMPAAIRAAIDFLRRASQEAKTDDPECIHAVAGALKILSDVEITKQVIDARFAGAYRPEDKKT